MSSCHFVMKEGWCGLWRRRSCLSEWPSWEISSQAVKLAVPAPDLDLPAAVSHQKDGWILSLLVGTCAAHTASTCQTSVRGANKRSYYHAHYPEGRSTAYLQTGLFPAYKMKGWTGHSLKSSLPLTVQHTAHRGKWALRGRRFLTLPISTSPFFVYF